MGMEVLRLCCWGWDGRRWEERFCNVAVVTNVHIQTVLQQHVLFWDRDGDGEIYPWDTYVGFRDLGFSVLFSLLAVVIINVNFSYPTRLAVSWLPDPWFRVYVGSIHKAKVSAYLQMFLPRCVQ